MLKKVLTTLMVLIILVLFALTWYSSRKTEQLFIAQIETINNSYPQLIQIQLENYQRHLFVSQARTKISTARQELTLNHQIRHFIWGMTITSSLAENSGLAAQFAEKIPVAQLTLVSDINFKGTVKSRLEFPGESLRATDGSFAISGLTLNWQPAEPSISPNFELKVKKLVLGQTQRAISLEDMAFSASSYLENETYSHADALHISRLDLAGEELRNGLITLKLSGLHQESLQDLAVQLQRMVTSEQTVSPQTQFDLLALYAEILKSGLTLKLEELQLESATGKLIGTGFLILQPTDDILGALVSMSNINAGFQLALNRDIFKTGYRLVNNFPADGEGLFQPPTVLNEKAEQLIEKLIAQGIFTKQQETGRFGIDFSFSGGEASLNGRVVN